MITAAVFQQNLGAELATRLGPQWQYFRSRKELRTAVADGHHVIIIAGSNKYSPHIEVAFYFGKNFTAARTIEKQLGIYAFPYHVQQYSPNFAARGFGSFRGPCVWSVNIHDPPPGLLEELSSAIQELAIPFLEKFGDMRVARDAIASNDRDVFGGRMFWGQLLRLDLALGDLEHFGSWAAHLDHLSQQQANEIIQKFIAREQ